MSQNDEPLPAAPPESASAGDAPLPLSPRGGSLSLQAKFALGLVLAVALALLFWPRGVPERRIEDSYLVDESGAAVSLVSQLEPATLVHFWATWCPPCRLEIPGLLEFAGEIGPSRLGLVLVAVADERERAVKFIGNRQFPVLFDPVWDVARRFRTRQLPETHLILDGKIVASFVGASDWRSEAVRRTVLTRLTAHAPPAAPAR